MSSNSNTKVGAKLGVVNTEGDCVTFNCVDEFRFGDVVATAWLVKGEGRADDRLCVTFENIVRGKLEPRDGKDAAPIARIIADWFEALAERASRPKGIPPLRQ